MDSPKAAATPSEADREAPEAKDLKIGPGVGTLLNGAKPAESGGQCQPEPTGTPLVRSKLTLLKWSLLAADLALVGLVAFMMLSAPQARTPLRIGVCVGALGLGAWLGCLAFWWKPDAVEQGRGDSTRQPGANEPGEPHR